MNVFDIIGPVMIGPSSSHTAGAARLGKVAKIMFGKNIKKAHIYMHGSFAKTGKGHGTDKAIIAGLLGMEPDNENLRYSFEIAKEQGLEFEFSEIKLENVHPNTVRIELVSENDDKLSMEGSSVGGGSILVYKLNNYEVNLNFENPSIVVVHTDYPGVIAKVTDELYKYGVNICDFHLSRKSKGGEALMTIGMDSMPDRKIEEDIYAIDYVSAVNILDRL